MVEWLVEYYPELLLYTSWFSLFLYFFMIRSYPRMYYRSYQEPINQKYALFLTNVKNNRQFQREQCLFMLEWLPKTVRQKVKKNEDEPDGIPSYLNY